MTKPRTIHEQFKEKCEAALAHRLPRWEELPEIELYMDQVIAVMERYLSIYMPLSDGRIITPSIINNYVKLKVIPAPKAKKYSRTHLAYLIVICILKQTLSIKSISGMINLGLETADIKTLYNTFCDSYEQVAAETVNDALHSVDVGKDRLYAAYSALTIKSSIISTTGRFLCESVVRLNEEAKALKQPEKPQEAKVSAKPQQTKKAQAE